MLLGQDKITLPRTPAPSQRVTDASSTDQSAQQKASLGPLPPPQVPLQNRVISSCFSLQRALCGPGRQGFEPVFIHPLLFAVCTSVFSVSPPSPTSVLAQRKPPHSSHSRRVFSYMDTLRFIVKVLPSRAPWTFTPQRITCT